EPLRAAKRAHCTVISCDMDSPLPLHTEALWLTSPHNPCGRIEIFPADQHGVFDESYMPFAERQRLGVMPNVLRLGSLTKTFCIPGLRLGYMIAQEPLLTRLQGWLPPWPASTLALHLLPKLLCEACPRDATVVASRERLVQLLKTHRWQVKPSSASFVLAKPPLDLPDFDSQRILVRSFPEWESLQGWVRLGLPHSESHWQRLNQALSH
ncbi:MAG: aminotransferase class I/II-fold pyridoxal phosphate-dependent enzyme, partial [Ghiorsea sp.]